MRTGPLGRHSALTSTLSNNAMNLAKSPQTAWGLRDGKWFVAYRPEVPGANGQGLTKPGAVKNLSAAIALILEDRREDALRGLPKGAVQEMVTVG